MVVVIICRILMRYSMFITQLFASVPDAVKTISFAFTDNSLAIVRRAFSINALALRPPEWLDEGFRNIHCV